MNSVKSTIKLYVPAQVIIAYVFVCSTGAMQSVFCFYMYTHTAGSNSMSDGSKKKLLVFLCFKYHLLVMDYQLRAMENTLFFAPSSRFFLHDFYTQKRTTFVQLLEWKPFKGSTLGCTSTIGAILFQRFFFLATCHALLDGIENKNKASENNLQWRIEIFSYETGCSSLKFQVSSTFEFAHCGENEAALLADSVSSGFVERRDNRRPNQHSCFQLFCFSFFSATELQVADWRFVCYFLNRGCCCLHGISLRRRSHAGFREDMEQGRI